MTSVVEKDFVWKFIDEATDGIRQAQASMNEVLSIFKSSNSVLQESADSMASFGNKAQSATDQLNTAMNESKDSINKVKDSIDGLPNDKKINVQAEASEFIEKIKNSKETLKEIPKNVRTELIALAKEQGITNFDEKLKEIPKERQTELVAKIANNEAIDFKKELELIPKEHNTQLNGKGNQAPIHQFKNDIDEIPTQHNTVLDANPKGEPKIKGFVETLKGTAIGMGVYNAAMKVGTAVSEQFSDAVGRYDQLNRFPKVLENMGASATDANASVKTLSKGIDGLPTSLNEIESASMRFMPITNNANLAAKSALALNDALISSGATAQDASDGLKEWTEMLDEGKPKMMQWQELTRVMSPALQKVAKSFGITSGSTMELYKKLQSGQITMKQLNDKMLELDKGTKGFANSAHNATAGIGTAFTNLKIRITKAFADALKGFDSFVKQVSGRSIAQNINNLSLHFSDFGKKAKQAFSGLAPVVKAIMPVLTVFGSYIKGVFVGTIKPIQDVGKALSDMTKKIGKSKAINDVDKALKSLAKNKRGIEEVGKAVGMFGTILLSLMGVSKVISILKGLPASIIGIGKAIKTATSSIGIWKIAIALVITGFVELYKHSAKFRKFVNDILSAVKRFSKNFINGFKSAFSKVTKTFSKWGSDIGKLTQKAINGVKNFVTSGLNVINHFWSSTWNGISNFARSIWNGIVNFIKWYIKMCSTAIRTELNIISKVWNSIWNGIKSFTSFVWNGIKNAVSSAINFVSNIISTVLHAIQSIWNSIWNAISSFFSGIRNGLKNMASSSINWIHDTISSVLDKISSAWHSMWSGLSSFFGSIWSDIKKFAQDGINGVLHVINAGIDGIDAVWKFFTGHETSIHHLKPVHFSQGGIVNRHLSMVNDGAGSDWKELIETPSGELMMSNQRNAILPLEAGTRVYSGEETRSIMNALGVEHYANGGIVGDIKHYADGGIVGDLIDWGGHELKDLGSWIKDKWDAITKFLKHPLENTKAIISKAITKPLEALKNSNIVQLGKGVFNKLTQPIADWFKKGLQKAKDEHDAEVEYSGKGNPGGAGVQRWASVIDDAAKKMNVSLSGDQKARLLRQIATESGGNPTIKQQIQDINSAEGHPAQGLLQFIPSTFAHWAWNGHNDILNGEDQIMAAINALNHGGEGGWSNIGDGHGWASGTHLTSPDMAWLADNPEHNEFVINPYAPSARPLLQEAMHETNMAQPETTTQSSSSSNSENDIGERIIALLEAILAKDTNVELESNSDKLRKHDAQLLRMINLQKGM